MELNEIRLKAGFEAYTLLRRICDTQPQADRALVFDQMSPAAHEHFDKYLGKVRSWPLTRAYEPKPKPKPKP